MDNAKDILGRVKEFFNDLINAPAPIVQAAPAKLQEYELKVGGKVQIDKLEPGGVVMIDGNPSVPGDLELMDGTKITVGDNGVISAVTPNANQAPAPPVNTDPASSILPGMDMSRFTEFENSTNEKFASYEQKFAAYEERFAQYEAKMEKANKVIEELLKLSQLIVDAPVVPADPTVRPSNLFKEEPKEKNFNILFS